VCTYVAALARALWFSVMLPSELQVLGAHQARAKGVTVQLNNSGSGHVCVGRCLFGSGTPILQFCHL
jgi:hypothetical protein